TEGPERGGAGSGGRGRCRAARRARCAPPSPSGVRARVPMARPRPADAPSGQPVTYLLAAAGLSTAPATWPPSGSSTASSLRTSVPPLRFDAAAVVTDLGVEQFQAFLLFEQGLTNPFAMAAQERDPLGLAGSRPHELGVAEHVAHGYAGRAEPAQQQEPVQVRVAEAPAPVRGAADAVQQADPLVPAERVLRQPALLGRLPDGPARHPIDTRRWSALQRKPAGSTLRRALPPGRHGRGL